MGYSDAWRGRINALAEGLGLPVQTLAVADIVRDDETEPAIRGELALRRAILDEVGLNGATVSPCTNCYNCKILSLVNAARYESANILFAHHADDALSSFLKSALMYLDRWRDGNETFDRARFRVLCMQIATDLRDGQSGAIDRLTALIASGHAQTSEPPVEQRDIKGQPYRIGRPMFFVPEATTAEVVRDLGLRAESSGCGHTAAAGTRTPREIVHYELLPFVAETDSGRAALQNLFDAVSAGLCDDGTTNIDVRGARHLILGARYKGGPETLSDRL